MTGDKGDHPGIKVPPPLIYVVPLVLGAALGGRRRVPFLPPRAARALG